MEKADMTKLEVAIKYIERIADGCNPVNNQPLGEDAALNNPNVIRCMFFIKEILEEVRRNGGVIGKRAAGRAEKEPFPFEILKEFRYESDKSITYLMKQIQAPLEERNVKRIAVKTVTGWLKAAGYLTVEYSKEVEKEATMPTEKGKQLGIYTEIRSVPGSSYLTVIYNQNAQEFIVQNLELIADGLTEDGMTKAAPSEREKQDRN